MIRFETRLDGRDPHDVRIRHEEAIMMFELGFNFSIFGEEGTYRLSRPFETIREVGSDIIVFQQ